MSKKIEKVEFAPGCFDDFEGSQEELDELVKAIENKLMGSDQDDLEMVSVPLEDVWDDLDDDTQQKLIEQLKEVVKQKAGEERKLN